MGPRGALLDYGRRARSVALPIVLILSVACSEDAETERIQATSRGTYDPETGRLARITYDANKNGKVDTWTKMDGARQISSEIDANEDGVIDRWEEYGDQGQLVRAGWRRQNRQSEIGNRQSSNPQSPIPNPQSPIPNPQSSIPKPDSWAYMGPDGKTARIDYLDTDNAGQQVLTRREFYEKDVLVRVAEDKDGDGVMDQWETREAGVLKSVEFDDGVDGRPDRRFTYSAAGALVLIESAPDANGQYTKRVVPGGR